MTHNIDKSAKLRSHPELGLDGNLNSTLMRACSFFFPWMSSRPSSWNPQPPQTVTHRARLWPRSQLYSGGGAIYGAIYPTVKVVQYSRNYNTGGMFLLLVSFK